MLVATQTSSRVMRPTTTDTEQLATLFVICCILGFDSFASTTMLAIVLIVLSPGKRARRMINIPEQLIDSAMTTEPMRFSISLDSPVNIDSSTSENPATTVPSVGICEFRATLKASPYWRRLVSTSLSVPL